MNNITGEQVFEAFRLDVQSFFTLRSDFEVRFEFGGSNISCKGSGNKTRICMPVDFRTQNIGSQDELHYWLLTIGHEMAHFLNRHNDHDDNSQVETRALEDWADFYGAKLMMAVVTFGEQTQAIYTSFDGNQNAGTRLDSIGHALGDLARTFYNTRSEIYSSRMTRVSSCVAGLMSFFDKYYQNIDMERSISVQMRIYRTPIISSLLRDEYKQLKVEDEVADTLSAVHQSIQGPSTEITKGLDPHLQKYIGTTFDTTPEQRREMKKVIYAKLKEQGVDLESGVLDMPRGSTPKAE